MMNLFARTGWGARALMLAVTLMLAAAPAAWSAIFTDIQGHPSQRAIERLAAKGIFRATGDKFNPNGTVARGEFAVLLTRAADLSAQPSDASSQRTCKGGTGPKTQFSVSDLKDGAEIPREMHAAVVTVATVGMASSKVEIKKGLIVYRLYTNKSLYGPNEEVVINFTVENTGKEEIKFEFATDLHFDIAIRDSEGNQVAVRSYGRRVIQQEMKVALAAGKAINYGPLSWGQCDQNDNPISPGRYEIVASQVTKSNPTSLTLAFNRGLMPVFADNTFRPKAEVTRAEMAATIVRAMGVSESSTLPNVTDVSEIPAGLRGAVAAAIEKRIVLVGPDRAFRPARPATRADVALALDALMDTLKRYNFQKGTLKDPVTGNPPQIAIEDDRKALRVYRVARNHAVYRNDRPAELRDLKPGDVLLFLNLGDVGDVVYIEATGR